MCFLNSTKPMMTEAVRIATMVMMLFNMCNQNDFNRKACTTDMEIWLYPELQRAWELRTGKETPYESENSMSKTIQPFIYTGREFNLAAAVSYNTENKH